MNTKQLGNIGETKALCKFVSLRVPVYQAFGDNERSDLIADFNGKLQRIQVKTSEKCEDGKMTFSFSGLAFIAPLIAAALVPEEPPEVIIVLPCIIKAVESVSISCW